ncbi:sarcosine oxidase subunit gamma family protein [Ottowia thiooxydans]|uniref:sarcosine oxidase subunit gamma family protein n=1 Tax=Ottowia thiooxydans TaxID=219182 RepID=UPI000A04169D|nr:sarcosine oxidase subunit gamma family protein [Ottowia thiooxydans]
MLDLHSHPHLGDKASSLPSISWVPWHPRYLLRSFDEKSVPSPSDDRHIAVRSNAGIRFALAPGEQLFIPEGSDATGFQEAAGPDVFFIDVSSAQLVLRVEGDRARQLLASGCGLDLRPARFAVNQFAQTRLGPFAVLIHRSSDNTYEVHVERSLGESLRAWLDSSASSLTGKP